MSSYDQAEQRRREDRERERLRNERERVRRDQDRLRIERDRVEAERVARATAQAAEVARGKATADKAAADRVTDIFRREGLEPPSVSGGHDVPYTDTFGNSWNPAHWGGPTAGNAAAPKPSPVRPDHKNSPSGTAAASHPEWTQTMARAAVVVVSAGALAGWEAWQRRRAAKGGKPS